MKKFLLLLLFGNFVCFKIIANNLYWVGNAGNWSDISHWSNLSGGSSCGCIPSLNDNVFFDGGSFNSGGQTVTIDQTAYCKSMSWAGVTNTPTFAGGQSLYVYGSFTLSSAMNVTNGNAIFFKSSSPGNTIQTFGKTMGAFYFDGAGGTWTLQDNLSVGAILHYNGTLNTNNVTVTSPFISSTGNGIRALTLGSSVINLSYTGYSPNAWEVTGSNATVNAGTSTINLTGTPNANFVSYGLTYYDVNFTSTTATGAYLQGSNTFHNVSFAGNGTTSSSNTYNNLTLGTGATTYFNGTQTVNGTFTCNGTCSQPSSLTNGTISKTSGAVNINYTRLQNVTATGGATFTANNVTDLGGNNGWTLNNPATQNLHWVGNGGNWTDPNHWSLSAGGSSSGCIPSPYDNVYFDGGSFNSGGQTVTIDQTAYCKSMSWAGVTNTPTFAGGQSLYVYGSFTLSSAMNVTNGNAIFFKSSSPGNTIQTFGKTMGAFYFDGAGGTWTLQDNLSVGAILHYNGTLNTNNVTVTSPFISSTGNGIRALTLGSSVINLSYTGYSPNAWEVTGSNATVNAGTSTINLTGTPNANFVSYGLTYYDVNFTSTTATGAYLQGSNTFHNVSFAGNGTTSSSNNFNNLTLGTGATTYFTGTQTVSGTFTCNGTSTTAASINGGTIHKVSGIVCINKVNLSNSIANGGAIFYAGYSQNSGNNSGWLYQTCSAFLEPKIYLSKSVLMPGETELISGSDFTSNGQINLVVKNPLGDTIPINPLTYLPNGKFSYSLPITASFKNGEYQVFANDSNSGSQTPGIKFYVSNLISRTLKITEPSTNGQYEINKPIKIYWIDFITITTTSNNTVGTVQKKYKIEYSNDNASTWHIIEGAHLSTNLSSNQPNSIFSSYTFSQSGNYKIKITDLDNLSNQDISEQFVITTSPGGAITQTLEWDKNLPLPTILHPLGLAADGTSRILVKLHKDVGNNKTVKSIHASLTDPNGLISGIALLGKIKPAANIISYSEEANNANNTTCDTIFTPSSNDQDFNFWIVSPDDFTQNLNSSKSERIIKATFIITYSDNSTTTVSNNNLRIVRPPLFMIHGLNSSGSQAFGNSKFDLGNGVRNFSDVLLYSNSIWKTGSIPNLINYGSFDQNAYELLFNPEISFWSILSKMRNKGFASNKVDYVCHSMGGDIARAIINHYANQYYSTKNYHKGFINKLITLNTPHNGSPIADFVIDRLIPNSGVYWPSHDYSFQGILVLDHSYLLGSHYVASPALKDLRAVNGGVRFNSTNVKFHMIGGDIDRYNTANALFIAQLNGDEKIKQYLDLFEKISPEGVNTVNTLVNYLNTYISNHYNYPNYLSNSDVIVPISSEFPGLNINNIPEVEDQNAPPSVATNSYGISRWHGGITDDIIVGTKVMNLLNSPINSGNFGNQIVANSNPNGSSNFTQVTNPSDSLVEYVDSIHLHIISPYNNSIVTIDSTISVNIAVYDTINLKKIEVLYQGENYESSSKAAFQTFNIKIQPNYQGRTLIMAKAIYDSLGFSVYHTDTTYTKVISLAPLNGFYVTPKSQNLLTNHLFNLQYNAVFDHYISSLSSNADSLVFSIADTNVVKYIDSLETFVTKDTGSTFIKINFRGFSDTAFVYLTLPQDNIKTLCVGSSLALDAGFISPNNSYQWQLDTGGGFSNISDNTFYSGTNLVELIISNPPTDWYNYKFRCVDQSHQGPIYSLKFETRWIGDEDSAWENPSNWACGNVPDSNTDVIIPEASERFPVVSSNAVCHSLKLEDNAAILTKSGYTFKILGKP